MKIKTRLEIVYWTTLAIFLLISYVILEIVVLAGFRTMEESKAADDIGRCVNAIIGEGDELKGIAADWGEWDDSYEFMDGRGRGFVNTNLSDDTFVNLNVNLIWFVDTKGNVKWGRIIDRTTAEELTSDSILEPSDGEMNSLMKPRKNIELVADFIRTKRGLMIAASSPILRTDSTGPSRGRFIVGRFLDAELVARQNASVRVQFDVFIVDGSLPQEQAEILNHVVSNETLTIVKESPKSLYAYRPILNDAGEPMALVRATVARDVMAAGRQAVLGTLLAIGAAGLFIQLVLRISIQRLVTKPIVELASHAESVGKSKELSRRILSKRSDEIGKLAVAFDGMLERLEEDDHERLRLTKELEELSWKDGLTGLANRRSFDAEIERAWRVAKRRREPLSLIMADADCFKAYNDHHGHQSGDDLLRRFAAGVSSVASRPGDMVARYGGEELAIILPATDANGALHLANEIQIAIRNLQIPHLYSTVAPIFTASLGIATLIPQPGGSPSSLVEEADRALYRAKELGRDRVEQAVPE